MSLNTRDRKDIVTNATNDDYKWNSDNSKLVKGNKTIEFGSSGGTVKVGNSTYNTSSGAKKSKNW